MQAIARVNRVFKDKPGGLIVDYIGIADSLKEALKEYTADDREQTGIDTEKAVEVMLAKFEVIQICCTSMITQGLNQIVKV